MLQVNKVLPLLSVNEAGAAEPATPLFCVIIRKPVWVVIVRCRRKHNRGMSPTMKASEPQRTAATIPHNSGRH